MVTIMEVGEGKESNGISETDKRGRTTWNRSEFNDGNGKEEQAIIVIKIAKMITGFHFTVSL